jgi:hypothetical protein
VYTVRGNKVDYSERNQLLFIDCEKCSMNLCKETAMAKKLQTLCTHSAKDFKKQGKRITKLAKKHGLTAITNRLSLFIDGKPCRRWWLANKTGVLLSVEYGLIDREAINFLTNEIND